MEFKNALGIKYQTASYYLKYLDRFNLEHGNSGNLEQDVVEAWVRQTELASKSQNRSFLPPIREFGRYLVSIGFDNAYVLGDKYKMQRYRANVYLMSEIEINKFFEACDIKVSNSIGLGKPYVLPAFYRFLYSCGVRCGEARNLKCLNVHLNDGYIDILQSKAHRDRRLFLSDELVDYFKKYENKIVSCFPTREYFFPSITGGMYSCTSISYNFRKIWLSAGLTRDGDVKPRAYDFRHHFACANVIRWTKDGLDAHTMLPYLMRYMGHTSLESTYHYLHLIPDFFPQYSLLASSAEGLIPEVEENEV
jgi:integrase